MPEAEVISLARPAQLDVVEGFLTLTEGVPSPEIFRLWAGIGLVAGCMERRVWAETGQQVTFPNLYVLLVAPPGVGKTSAIKVAEDLWSEVKGLHTAPDSMTAASMLDALGEAHRVIVREGKPVAEYHSLILPADEFSVFCPAYDLEFLGRLNKIYDNPRRLRVRRKYLKEEVNILHPQLNILSGAQPGLLASLLPEEAWSMGFTRRLLMIYAGSGPQVELFATGPDRGDLRAEIVKRLAALAAMFGKMYWESDAARKIVEWHRAGGPPKPTHSKLSHYCSVRTQHVAKLCMVASASRAADYRITLADVDRALSWLLQAELLMPDIFREMVGKSDGDVIRELHFFLWRLWSRDKKPLHESRLINFLKDRVTHEKVLRIIELSERANIISRQAGTQLYVPKPTTDHGMME